MAARHTARQKGTAPGPLRGRLHRMIRSRHILTALLALGCVPSVARVSSSTPQAPHLRRAANAGPFCAAVSWDPPSFADFGRLEVHAGPAADFAPEESTLAFRTTSLTDTSTVLSGLLPDTHYYVRIRGVQHNGASYLSPSLDLQTGPAPPQTHRFF